jgi:molybdate/tungstate transport system substrate-binding protein
MLSSRLATLLAATALSCLAAMPAHAADDSVQVLYAGSLTNLMERSVGPAFEQASGLHFAGYAAGSNKIANEVRGKLREGDVFISASPKVNDTLMGAQNGNHVGWYLQFAASSLVIGYNARSRFAAALKSERWDTALQSPGLRLGRTDPKLDPKGALTLALVDKAAQLYHEPDLTAKLLGDPENPAQVLPEEALIGRLQSGELDAGFFYSTETSDAHIPALPLPAELAAQADYTVTILADAKHPEAALRFVEYLLGPSGRALLQQHGLTLVAPSVHGVTTAVPAALQALVDTAATAAH